MEAIVDRQVRQYQVSEYEKGQRATDYTTWLTSNVHYTAKFEEVGTTIFLLAPCLKMALSYWRHVIAVSMKGGMFCLLACQSVTVHLSVCLSVCPSVCLSVWLPIPWLC